MRLLIRSSLTTQEQDRVVSEGRGGGRRALVIGGAGRMGKWFADFLASQGYRVEIADPAADTSAPDARRDWREGDLDQDIIVVAAPLAASGAILESLAQLRPPGLIFDVGSLKSPLRRGLDALAAAEPPDTVPMAPAADADAHVPMAPVYGMDDEEIPPDPDDDIYSGGRAV